jgi:CxxC-x17-CxxC domain-containing protein
MFSVTCDECGKRCEVPFKPSSNKPVYCSECFGQKEDGRDRDNRRSDRNDGPRPQASSSELTDALKGINDKLDRLLRALELRSKPEAPVDYKAKQEVVAPKAEKIVAEKPVKAKKAVAAPKKEVKKVAKKKAKAE